MNVNQMFPSKYVSGSDLDPEGVKVTIVTVRQEKMMRPGTGEVDGWVLVCENARRGVVLSGALARQIAEAVGSYETDDWPGKSVVLFPVDMVVYGRSVTAIRARAG